MLNINPIIATDSYKVSHYKQYPPDTGQVFSYFEPRGLSNRMRLIHEASIPNEEENSPTPEIVFFGALQFYLRHYLSRVTLAHIKEAEELFASHFGHLEFFNRAGWERVVFKHDGYLPVRIRAVPEGTRVPVGNALLTAVNLDDELPWVTNYLETRLSHVWYPVTVATQSHYCRHIIEKWLKKNGSPDQIDFKLHDFGYRGVSSEIASAIGGIAHLISFKGTDTMSALVLARDYYDCKNAGFSIPAAEHSTITSWRRDSEERAYRNMLHQYPTGLVAIVSDSYDIYNACERIYGELLRDEILRRDGTVVIRPDSGDPMEVLPKVLSILGQKFGWEINQKGYRVLHPKVRVIQGDGVTPLEINKILASLDAQGWSADNIAFGMGGGLLQQVNRDDLKCAFKCSAVKMRDGMEWGVSKNPITDRGKISKSGRLSLYRNEMGLYTGLEGIRDVPEVMQTVYENGFVLVNDSLELIRSRAIQAMPAGV